MDLSFLLGYEPLSLCERRKGTCLIVLTTAKLAQDRIFNNVVVLVVAQPLESGWAVLDEYGRPIRLFDLNGRTVVEGKRGDPDFRQHGGHFLVREFLKCFFRLLEGCLKRVDLYFFVSDQAGQPGYRRKAFLVYLFNGGGFFVVLKVGLHQFR